MNADTRLYRIIKNNDATAYVEVKCLAVKEDVVVASNITKTEPFQALIDATPLDEDFSNFGLKVGETYSEADMIAYAQQRADLNVINVLDEIDVYIA